MYYFLGVGGSSISGCKKKNHIAHNIHSWDRSIIIRCPMNDSAHSAGKKVTWGLMRLRFYLYLTVDSREWRQPSGRPPPEPQAASGPGARCPSCSRAPAAAGVSGQRSRSPAGVPLRPGSAAGSERLRSATGSIRSAVPRAIHSLAERSVRARPGGAVGGGAGPSPGSCAAKVEMRKFPGAADR